MNIPINNICIIFKHLYLVARNSSSYSSNFLKKTKTVPLNLARQRYPRQNLANLKRAFNDSLSFLIVRHPLERLLSAYRDKMEHSLPHSLHRKLGVQIIMKYRPIARGRSNTRVKQRWPTFEEFVLFLFDSVRRGDTLDMHWTPIVEFCTPCMFDFDVIAHTETLMVNTLLISINIHNLYILHKEKIKLR